jgi:hypothetical protein
MLGLFQSHLFHDVCLDLAAFVMKARFTFMYMAYSFQQGKLLPTTQYNTVFKSLCESVHFMSWDRNERVDMTKSMQ